MSLSLENILKNKVYIISSLIAILPISAYYLYRRLTRKQVAIDKLDDTIPVDVLQQSNKKTKSIPPQASPSQSEVTPEMAEVIKPNIDEKTITSILKRISQNVLNTIVMTYDLLNEDYDKATQKFKAEKITLQDMDANKFKAAIIYNLVNDNRATLKDFKVNDDDYKFALKYYMVVKKNEKISRLYEFINKILLDFQKEDCFKIDFEFPQEIKDNYLKIVTNTFYHTLRKVTALIKGDYDKGKTKTELSELIGKYYQTELLEVRKNVLKFFKVKDEIVQAITLVRCYVFTLERNDPARKQHESFLHLLSQVEDNLAIKIISEEFLDNTNTNYTEEIKDEVIDLNRLVVNTVDLNKIYS